MSPQATLTRAQAFALMELLCEHNAPVTCDIVTDVTDVHFPIRNAPDVRGARFPFHPRVWLRERLDPRLLIANHLPLSRQCPKFMSRSHKSDRRVRNILSPKSFGVSHLTVHDTFSMTRIYFWEGRVSQQSKQMCGRCSSTTI